MLHSKLFNVEAKEEKIFHVLLCLRKKTWDWKNSDHTIGYEAWLEDLMLKLVSTDSFF